MYRYSAHRHAVRKEGKVPVWVSEGVGSRQISSQVVSQQQHFLQAHLLPPFFQGIHKLLLGPLGLTTEQRAAASAKAQQIHGVDQTAAGERVQILSP